MSSLTQTLLGLAVLASLGAAAPVTTEYTILSTSPNIINLNITARADGYTVLSDDTIQSIAASYGVGVCDIARLNVLADAEMIYPGEVLNIPETSLFPNDYSCIATNNTAANSTCVLGGPHTYETVLGDTVQKIANQKFNITIDSLLTAGGQTDYITDMVATPYATLEEGQEVKIPVCDNTACTMSDFTFSYGTLQDFASQYSVTVGQLMAVNLGYNHTEDIAPLAVMYDCTELS